ncbi:MAG TPA: RNase adapter RapZ [Armatimonadota bacterium]|jgi:UPF0042 nucleotide-binding protein
MRIVVLTGMSGAGRTAALRVFEDLGYFGVDNLPPPLLLDLAVRCEEQGDIEQVAVVMDLRAGEFFSALPEAIQSVRAAGFAVEILYLDCTEETLVRRFKETRRKHPLYDMAGSVARSLEVEREALAPVREIADRVLDTSRTVPRDLAADLRQHYATKERPGGLQITVVSFGFKYGLPIDADLVFDLRFLRNPHWDDSLRQFTGRDKAVQDYIDEDPRAAQFLGHIENLLSFAVPCYRDEGKAYLTVAIGCTGGQHRSVCFGERITAFLKSLGHSVTLSHRELNARQ